MGLAKTLAERRGVGRGYAGGYGSGGFGDFTTFGFGSGLDTEENILDLHFLEPVMRIPIVWACARVRADRIAAMQIIDENGDLPEFLRQPFTAPERSMMNPLSVRDFMQQFVVSYDTAGNTHLGVTRGSGGRVLETKVLDPVHVRIRLDEKIGRYRIYFYDNVDREIITVPNMQLPAWPVGLSPVIYQQMLLTMSKAGQRHAASFLQNSSVSAGVISTEGDYDEEQVRLMQRRWRRMTRGPSRANMPVFIGNAKWQPIGSNPRDAQLMEQRQYIDSQICALYGVDPTLVGLPSPGKSPTTQTHPCLLYTSPSPRDS